MWLYGKLSKWQISKSQDLFINDIFYFLEICDLANYAGDNTLDYIASIIETLSVWSLQGQTGQTATANKCKDKICTNNYFSHFDYCSCVLGSANVEKLYKLKNGQQGW